jgi:hypothetical protein
VDALIKKTVKKELQLDEQIKSFVDRSSSRLDLDEVLDNPEAVLEEFATELMEKLLRRFMNEYILEGILFADSVKRSKEDLDLSKPIDGLKEIME